jgi:hypothetical protein
MMTTERFLQMLFGGYVRSFASFRWYAVANYTDLTAKELHHFTEIGERLGFIVRREMNWDYPRDLCWVKSTDATATPFLYLERESKDIRMGYTIEKMLNPENGGGIPILVASFGHLRETSFEKASARLQAGVVEGQAALLFAWVAESENAARFEMRASVITQSRSLTTQAMPYLIEDERYWCMRFEGGAPKWRQLALSFGQ